MARKAFFATLGQSLGEGRYNTVGGANTPLATSFTDIAALQAAVDDAQTAAEANDTISGNPTALGLVEAIGTAFAAYVAAVTAGSTAASGKNAILDIDDAVVTNRNALKAVLDSIARSAQASGMASG